MYRKVVFVLLLAVLIFTGCKKQKEKDIQPSKDFAIIANDLFTLIPLVKNIAITQARLKEVIFLGKDSLNTCALISFVSGDTSNISNSSPLTFDVNFNTGCLDKDLIIKKGIIRCTVYGTMSSLGANCTIKFIGFEIGGNALSGTVSFINSGALTFLVTTSNFKLQVGKKYINYDADIRMKQTTGANSPNDLLDDAYTVTSSSILTDRYGKEVEVIAYDLFKLYSCSWISGGYAELIDDDNKVQVVDFGERICDNKAFVSIEENVYTVDFP